METGNGTQSRPAKIRKMNGVAMLDDRLSRFFEKVIRDTDSGKMVWRSLSKPYRDRYDQITVQILDRVMIINHDHVERKTTGRIQAVNEINSFDFPRACESRLKQLYDAVMLKKREIPAEVLEFIDDYLNDFKKTLGECMLSTGKKGTAQSVSERVRQFRPWRWL